MPNDASAPPPALHHVFYVSRCRAGTSATDVQALVDSSLRNNLQRAVTGMLLYTGGHFAQVIEGPPDATGLTMDDIDADGRHEAVTRMSEGAIVRRRFSTWTMAFHEAPGADDLLAAVLGAVPVPPTRARRLMRHLFLPAVAGGAQPTFSGARNS